MLHATVLSVLVTPNKSLDAKLRVSLKLQKYLIQSLREKCPNAEFFLTRIFLHFPVFGLNTGKYGPEKTPYLDTFHTVIILNFHSRGCSRDCIDHSD